MKFTCKTTTKQLIFESNAHCDKFICFKCTDVVRHIYVQSTAKCFYLFFANLERSCSLVNASYSGGAKVNKTIDVHLRGVKLTLCTFQENKIC